MLSCCPESAGEAVRGQDIQSAGVADQSLLNCFPTLGRTSSKAAGKRGSRSWPLLAYFALLLNEQLGKTPVTDRQSASSL